jgi:hypothetical protein
MALEPIKQARELGQRIVAERVTEPIYENDRHCVVLLPVQLQVRPLLQGRTQTFQAIHHDDLGAID